MTARVRVAACIALALGAAPARAAVTTYTSQAAFAAAIAALDVVAATDFDSLANATVLPSGSTVGGVTFTYAISGGVELIVVGGFPTTSGTNSLGTIGDLVLLAGDAFAIQFPAATAVGLHVIGEDMLPGDVELATDAGSISNGSSEQALGDGSEVFFLGLVESDPALAFTSATITSFPVEDVGDYVWNVDDVVAAPEPGSLAAAAGAALALVIRRAAWRRTTADRSASRPDWYAQGVATASIELAASRRAASR